MFAYIGQEYNYLIDGGHAKHLSNVLSCMDEYGVKREHGIQLHGIIVTHPDVDHLNGITKLLERHRQEFRNDYDVVITEAFYWRSKQDVCTRFLKLMDRLYHKRDTSGVAICLSPGPGLNCYFPKESGCSLRCRARDDTVRPSAVDKPLVRRIQPSETFTKEAPKQVDANETSTLTVVNQSERKCDAVLTGDSTTREIMPLVEGKEIGIFQVPHHGSSLNSRLKDRGKLVEYSGQYNLSIVHNNEVKEILLFYSTFRAQCYLISAGGTESYKHPHPFVMQGIILANSLRHYECVIVLTNSRGLNSEKLKQLHRLAPQWTQYVKIHHLDDVFITEQHHTSLHPESCINDVRANTVEWTPEGYINRTKITLPVKLTSIDHRPLERNRFIEKSTVEIIIQKTLKFSAHIICIPLPHNPRSGDSINCCYVIEESIASEVCLSKALFLLDNDEKIRSLSRAKKYVLFQYINNEWEKKQLPATVQDRSPQASPCHIPYDSIHLLWSTNDSATQISPAPSPSPHQRINSCASSLQREQNSSPQTPSSRTPQRSTTSVQPVQNISPQSPPIRIQYRSAQPAQRVTPPNHIPPQRETSAPARQNVPPQTPPSSVQHRHRRIQPVQTTSSQTPPSIIPHQSGTSLQPAQAAISPLTPPSRISHPESVHSVQQEQNTQSFQIPPSFSPHQSSSPQLVQAIAPPSHIPHQSIYSDQQVQNISVGFIAPQNVNIPQPVQQFSSHIPQQNVDSAGFSLLPSTNFLQTVQLFSPQIPPSHTPQQNVTCFQPALGFSQQISPYSVQQLPQSFSSLQIGSEGATAATNNYGEVHIPQHRSQPTQYSTARPSPAAQNFSEYQSPTKGCGCKKIGCSDNRCGCRKQGSFCGPNCQCIDCKNNQLYSFHQAQSPPRVTPGQNISVRTVASPSKGCGCKTGCGTMRCGCKKKGVSCGPGCKCKNTYSNCVN